MLKHASATFAGALLLAAGAATAQTPPPPGVQPGQETSIPFITFGTLRNFEAGPRGEGIYIQNNRRDWYYASFSTRCDDLPWTARIGFKTYGGGASLERGDTIIAGDDRCRIASIVRSGPPPKKAKKPRKA